MPFKPVPFTIECRIIGDHNGDKRITTLHYRYPIGSPPTAQLLTDVVNDVATRIIPKMAAVATNITRWTAVTATDINAANGTHVELALSPAIAGARSEDALPGNVNFAMKKSTNTAGKHTWGTLFVPDITENFQADSVVNSTFLTAMISLAQELLRRTPASTLYPPVVASKEHAIFYLVLSIAMNAGLDSLITRLVNHRRHKRRPATTA